MKNDENQDSIELLRRIASATEKTARYTFLMAIPILLAIVLAVLGFVLSLLFYFMVPGRG